MFRPPAALTIDYHYLFELCLELNRAKVAAIILTLKIGIAAVCFFKIHLDLLNGNGCYSLT